MIMCYNFFVGMCSRCIELIHLIWYNTYKNYFVWNVKWKIKL